MFHFVVLVTVITLSVNVDVYKLIQTCCMVMHSFNLDMCITVSLIL
jgi:hypothetical protein